MLLFCLALAVPVGYLVVRTEAGLSRQEEAEFRFFAQALFDRLEEELADFVAVEEARDIDDYAALKDGIPSPLAEPPAEPWIVGWLQNDPDGSMRTPLATPGRPVAAELAGLYDRLASINRAFNHKRTMAPAPSFPIQPSGMISAPAPGPSPDEAMDEATMTEAFNKELRLKLDAKTKKGLDEPVFAERYLDKDQAVKKEALGQGKVRVEQVPQAQAKNVAPPALAPLSEEELPAETAGAAGPVDAEVDVEVDVEVAPLQAVSIDERTMFLFRRVVIDGQVFRQGVALDAPAFAEHLVADHFAGQPMAEFADLSLSLEGERVLASGGAAVDKPRLTLTRVFPRPFGFLTATLSCQDIPPAAGRGTLRAMTLTLAAVMLLGLLAIHQSTRVVLDHSRRRTQFVSSVTHELKTPLTNLRMYIEMLEQGMAPNPEREREYLEVLSSESARLSKLIENVLEFSRLESRRRTLELQEGDLSEVVEDVGRAMDKQLDEAGFELVVDLEPGLRAIYDREALIQVLMNLMENSLKFGARSPEKRITLSARRAGDRVLVSVADTGPGIPPGEVKKVFDDFYRVEAGLTRTTKGTGIGLALVKRFVRAMNGKVWAENNPGPGCAMVIALPRA